VAARDLRRRARRQGEGEGCVFPPLVLGEPGVFGFAPRSVEKGVRRCMDRALTGIARRGGGSGQGQATSSVPRYARPNSWEFL
jgi:hypothetical protein